MNPVNMGVAPSNLLRQRLQYKSEAWRRGATHAGIFVILLTRSTAAKSLRKLLKVAAMGAQALQQAVVK